MSDLVERLSAELVAANKAGDVDLADVLREAAHALKAAQEGACVALSGAAEAREVMHYRAEMIARCREYAAGMVDIGADPDALDAALAPLLCPSPSAPVGVIENAIRHLTNWLNMNDCECESGHQCGRTEVQRTRDQLRTLAQQPSVEDGISAVAAIRFALSDSEGMTFLRLWNEGEFAILRREWPEAPVEVYTGADPLVTRSCAQQPAACTRCGGEGEVASTDPYAETEPCPECKPNQQLAADGGFTAADMMDARQEGREEARQPAAVDDSLLLDALVSEHWKLDPFDMPTPGGDDADVGWRVIQYHGDEPREREVAVHYGDDPRAALRAALDAIQKGRKGNG